MTTQATDRTTIDLDASWSIGDKIHGGYLLAQVVRATLSGGQYPHPLGISAQFASAPDAGPADVDVDTLRLGRRVGFLRARLSQEGQARAEVLITGGTLASEQPRYVAASAVAPTLPDPDDCLRSGSKTPSGTQLGPAAHLDMRFDPATARWMQHQPSGEGLIRGWLRRLDGEPFDPAWLLIAGDALPPVTFDLGLRGWVPTVTLDAHIRALPAPGWLIAEQRAQVVGGGWLDETCTLWDSTGALVASVRQLAGYRE